MLGIGFWELIIIALVCLVALGPKQLPVVMRQLAKFYRQISSLKEEFSFQMMSIDQDEKPKKLAPPLDIKNESSKDVKNG